MDEEIALMEEDNEEIMGATWDQIECAIKRMNGYDRSLVMLRRGPSHMGIGGGLNSRFVVYVTSDNLHHQTAVNPLAPADEMIEMVCGGQPTEKEGRLCVDAGAALAAAKEFAGRGKLAETVTWESDD